MFFSGHRAEDSTALIQAAGLEIISARDEVIDEDGTPVTFFWIVARKPE